MWHEAYKKIKKHRRNLINSLGFISAWSKYKNRQLFGKVGKKERIKFQSKEDKFLKDHNKRNKKWIFEKEKGRAKIQECLCL